MLAPNARTVRVFLSSTFRDFAEERDLIVRKVFPELRRKCRERQVELVDVDLRWGITEEEAQQGKVLPICLAEIDRSRPFFMGFLGERYGWAPEKDQYDLSLLLEQPWLDEHCGGKSVTELEILHGVLNNPAMAERAFFYFRDPAYSESKGGAYLSEGSAEKEKLDALKERIRRSGFPVVENYVGPEELAERVREDLWKLIDEAYPESEVPDALTRERMTHEAYGASRRRLYLGGEPYLATLDAAMPAEPFRPVLVRGQSGGGKSALLANWVSGWSERHPGTAIIVHHLGCGADAADPVRMVVRLMREISRLTGDEFKPESDPEKQLEQIPLWLANASTWAQRTGRELLLVLDGLDKVSAFAHLRWFPGFLPQGVKLVASCLDGEILAAVRSRLDWTELQVEPFTPQDQTTFIENYLGRYRKALTEGQRRTLLAHPLSGNPLFLLTVLEELRVFGVHEQLESRLHKLLSPPPGKAPDEAPTVDDVFEHVLARIEKDLGRAGVQSAMESIWASRGGLYQDELLAIAGIAPATWAAMQNALDEALYESGGRIQFAHDYLRKAVEDRYGLTGEEKRLRHRRLAEWFAAREIDERVASELPWQWREAEAREELVACLVDKKIFEHEWETDEYELLGYWLWTGEDLEAAYEAAWSGWGQGSSERENTHLAECLGDFLQIAGFVRNFSEALYRLALEEKERALGPEHPDTLRCVHAFSNLLARNGNHEGAEALCHRVLEGYEKALGPDHPDTLGIVNNLGVLLMSKGDFDGAEALFRRALESQEKALGAENPDTLLSVRNLGVLLMSKGDYDRAEPLHRRALEGYEKALGLEHPTTMGRVEDLGILLRDKGDYDGAEALLCRAVMGYEKALGAEHPLTLGSVNNLGLLLRYKGDNDRAETLHRRALEGCEKSLGAEHPCTLSSVGSLGDLLSDKGDYDGAEPLLRRALEGYEKSLGAEHPDTLGSVSSLGNLLSDKGDYDGAEALYRRALKGKEKALGAEHPATLGSVSSLGNLLRHKGDYDGAEALYRRALEGCEKALGAEHPETLKIVNNLGNLLSDKGDYDGAEALHRRALEGRGKALGPEHPHTLISVNSLGNLLRHKGDYDGAEALYRRALEGCEKAFGAEHPETLKIVNNLGNLLSDKGDYDGAEALHRRALEGRGKALGPEHPHTLISVNSLGNLLSDKGDYDGAEALHRRALEGREKALGPEHPDTLISVNNFASLLTNNGDYEGAQMLCRRAVKGYEKALGPGHPTTLISASNLAFLLNATNRRPEALALLRHYAALSDDARDAVAYNLACYECLEGNHEEAKRLIAEHLERHPEKKAQALADEDFAAIQEFIQTL
jgi:tetratricopeptide (TPR) repeat protein